MRLAALCLMMMVGTASHSQEVWWNDLQVATRWINIGGSVSHAAYLDLLTVRPQGKWTKAWILMSLKTPDPHSGFGNRTYQSLVELIYADCAGGRSAVKQATFYSGPSASGDSIGSNSWTDEKVDWLDPVPGTLGETILERICAAAKGSKR